MPLANDCKNACGRSSNCGRLEPHFRSWTREKKALSRGKVVAEFAVTRRIFELRDTASL